MTFSSDGKTKSIVLLNAETVLHDYWGGTEYWMVRRSMRFNSYLVNVANVFRKEILNSTDAFDGTERPNDWRNEKVSILAYYGKLYDALGSLRLTQSIQFI